MTKRKTPGKTIADLVQLAKKLNIPEDALHDELRDAADEAAAMLYENWRGESLHEQLTILYSHGWGLGRLEEIIKENAPVPSPEEEGGTTNSAHDTADVEESDV